SHVLLITLHCPAHHPSLPCSPPFIALLIILHCPAHHTSLPSLSPFTALLITHFPAHHSSLSCSSPFTALFTQPPSVSLIATHCPTHHQLTPLTSKMQAFGWKRKKAGLSKPRPSAFSGENAEVKDETKDPDIDWLTATKRPKVLQLEDVEAKARRLSNEGVTLAEAERWWAAIGRWNAALALTPNDHTIHEMLSQAYMQTLGRAQLGLGEVAQAVKTFSRAVHIRPDQQELWREDLQWAVGLLKKYQEIEVEREKVKAAAKESGATITELPVPSIEGSIREKSIQLYQIQKQREAVEAGDPTILERGKNIDLSKMVRMRVT
ncbi:Tetratricopeptide repeat protein 33-like, partial [Homarus americanus]